MMRAGQEENNPPTPPSISHLQEPVERRLGLPGDPDRLVGALHVADEGRVRIHHRLLRELQEREEGASCITRNKMQSY